MSGRGALCLLNSRKQAASSQESEHELSEYRENPLYEEHLQGISSINMQLGHLMDLNSTYFEREDIRAAHEACSGFDVQKDEIQLKKRERDLLIDVFGKKHNIFSKSVLTLTAFQ